MKEPEKPEPSAKIRRPYEKPELKRVDLRPEEAVLGNCKTSTVSGPIQATCDQPSPCMALGS